MLLFIVAGILKALGDVMFQYISCYSLSSSGIFLPVIIGVSIHLMLLFIENLDVITANLNLRFNTSHVTLYLFPINTKFLKEQCFNTSHVTLYPFPQNTGQLLLRVSIHLMLLFIFCFFSTSDAAVPFQYISCYSLSLRHYTPVLSQSKFQYISCYSLSNIIKLLNSLIITFQYISCYSLSGTKIAGIECVSVSIHLMLLFIVQRKSGNVIVSISFNTSHVTLYRNYR